MADQTEMVKLILDVIGVKSVQELKEELKLTQLSMKGLISSWDQGNITSEKLKTEMEELTFRTKAYNQALAQAQAEAMRSTMTTEQQILSNIRLDTSMHGIHRASGVAQRGTADFSRALLQLGYAVDDVQYGFKGILNNIPQIGMQLGAGPGLVGMVSIVTTGVYQLYERWDDVATLWRDGETVREVERMKKLATATKVAADETKRLHDIKSPEQKANAEALDLAIGNTPGTFKTANAAMTKSLKSDPKEFAKFFATKHKDFDSYQELSDPKKEAEYWEGVVNRRLAELNKGSAIAWETTAAQLRKHVGKDNAFVKEFFKHYTDAKSKSFKKDYDEINKDEEEVGKDIVAQGKEYAKSLTTVAQAAQHANLAAYRESAGAATQALHSVVASGGSGGGVAIGGGGHGGINIGGGGGGNGGGGGGGAGLNIGDDFAAQVQFATLQNMITPASKPISKSRQNKLDRRKRLFEGRATRAKQVADTKAKKATLRNDGKVKAKRSAAYSKTLKEVTLELMRKGETDWEGAPGSGEEGESRKAAKKMTEDRLASKFPLDAEKADHRKIAETIALRKSQVEARQAQLENAGMSKEDASKEAAKQVDDATGNLDKLINSGQKQGISPDEMKKKLMEQFIGQTQAMSKNSGENAQGEGGSIEEAFGVAMDAMKAMLAANANHGGVSMELMGQLMQVREASIWQANQSSRAFGGGNPPGLGFGQ